MKSNIIRAVLAVIISVGMISSLSAEIVYLKDGQVLTGVIEKEDADAIYIRTKYHTQRVARDNITRILYGERYMEDIHLLMNDGSRVSGYLVDQDATRVLIRRDKDSPEEESYLKTDIRLISRKKIIPLEPDIVIRGGILIPLNSTDTKYKNGPAALIGARINFPWIEDIKVGVETGYIKSDAETKTDTFLQYIPFNFTMEYLFNFKPVTVAPRLGIGMVMIDFDDGETKVLRGYDLNLIAGLGLTREIITRRLSLGVWGEYNMIVESGYTAHNAILSGGLIYRF